MDTASLRAQQQLIITTPVAVIAILVGLLFVAGLAILIWGWRKEGQSKGGVAPRVTLALWAPAAVLAVVAVVLGTNAASSEPAPSPAASHEAPAPTVPGPGTGEETGGQAEEQAGAEVDAEVEQQGGEAGELPLTADGETLLDNITITNAHGYTSEFSVRFPRWNFAVDIMDAKPGEADVRWSPPFSYTATLTNTTEGRRAPAPETVTMYGVYPADSAACAPELFPPNRRGETGPCRHNLMIFKPTEDHMEPNETIPLWHEEQDEYGAITNVEPRNVSRQLSGLPEDLAGEVAESLSHDLVGYTIWVRGGEVTGGDCVLDSSTVGFGQGCDLA